MESRRQHAAAAAYPAPKRSLGQNFLADPRVAERMVESLGLTGAQTVLEIGGGRGAMTGLLAARARRLIVVEIDRRLAPLLAERFREADTVHVVEGDLLDLEPEALGIRAGEETVAFGNIPYYASSPILLWLAERRAWFRRAYLTMQREVAERIAAPPGGKEYGAITVRVAHAAHARRLFDIAPESFEPQPKVTSSFVELVFHERPPVTLAAADEAFLFRVVRGAFAQRRKKLRSALTAALPGGRAFIEAAGSAAGIDLSRRGETLSLVEFARLADALAAAG